MCVIDTSDHKTERAKFVIVGFVFEVSWLFMI
jgi:hypothetical protein